MSTQAKILVVEDDYRIASFLDRALSHSRYDVKIVREGAVGLALAENDLPDLVILDLMLPDIDGLEVARQLRARSGVPILMLTARDSVAERVDGLEAGADDYLIKPFALDELLARVRAMLRRLNVNAAAGRRGQLEYRDVRVDQDTRDASRGGRRLQLRNREFELLAYFLRNPERALSRRELRDEVWGDDFPGDSNVIEVTVGQLRQKLESGGAPRLIQTIRPIGYMLRDEPDAGPAARVSMARLTLVNALALSVGCIVAYLSMAQLHGLATRLSVEAELQDSARTFANTAPLGMSRADFGVRPDFIQGIAADGKVLLRSANLGNQQLPLAPQSLQRALASNGFFDTLTLDGHRLRAYVAPVQVSGGGDPSSRIVLVQVASPIEEDPHARLPLPWLAASAICGVLGTMLVGWLLARSAMAPVEQLATTVRAINSTEDLALRVPLQRFRTHGALRRLAEDVNNMLARLQAAAHELRVALEGQRRFVADASHELRTPLTSLRGNVQLLTHLVAENAGKAPPAERLEILRDMTHETERMSRLVDGLLLLARADAQQHLILTPTELAPLLQQAYRASRVLAEDVYVQLDRVAEGIWVLADPDRLQQVVLILLENAVKYTPAGGRVCLCSARVDLGGKPGVTIEVRDSGLGVAPVDRDLIFERFYRSESARKHAEGAGLGLAVARWIAREHGGDISLRDAEPTGSIFTVWLPTTDATDRPGI